MRIVRLRVENFRAIRDLEATDLHDMIVIAGPNGSGKSCILDAIRLFKSVYGGYQPNEWQQWMNEFQINTRNLQRIASVLRDPAQPSTISASIELADDEIQFISDNLNPMLEELAWRTVIPGSQNWTRSTNALATERRIHQPQVDKQVQELTPVVEAQLNHRRLTGQLEIYPSGDVTIHKNILLELVFSSFHPKNIGVIDYHSPHRDYTREELGGINLNLDKEEERLRSTSLYNAASKYSNIKSELAAELVKQNLREMRQQDGTSRRAAPPLAETLQELFSSFFPGKTFLGPVPTDTGTLEFPVQFDGGSTHDINDLSSGEKEILFGYLRLRNSAPRFSVILLDEPELHLNPGLVRGLPKFYRNHIGIALDNQIWLVTHSDAFLREAIGQEGIRVFHMQHAAAATPATNQLRELRADEEVQSAIVGLVGNLASYSPGAKVVFLEGEDSEFDLRMVSRLFPEVENCVNLVSGGNRYGVERLHRILEASVEAGDIPARIYSVVDRDTGNQVLPTDEFRRHYSWDAYHIENYLLYSKYIDEALGSIGVQHSDLTSLGKIDECLKQIAQQQIGQLVMHKIRSEINSEMIGCLELGANHLVDDVGSELRRSIERSLERITDRTESQLGLEDLRARVATEREILEQALENEDWRKQFRGRDILKEFISRYGTGMRYVHFRDLILSQMSSAGHEPAGMKTVLDQILID